MKRKNTINTLALILTVMMAINPVIAAEMGSTTDSQRIIDVESLQVILEKPSHVIQDRVEQTGLIDKFKTANEVLKDKDVDKKYLVQTLKDLSESINQFTNNYAEITDPLWEGQDALAKTIEKVHLLLARSGGGEPSEKVKKKLKNYDSRLSSLAKSIKAEKNETRKHRLEMVFANILSIRQLVERIGSVQLGSSLESVYVKIIDSLSGLEVALTNATFAVERTRIVLEGQSEFISEYCDLLAGLIDAEDLAKMLAKLNNAGNGIGGVDMSNLDDLVKVFEENMGQTFEQITGNIDAQTSTMVDMPDVGDVDLNDSIERYSNMQEN